MAKCDTLSVNAQTVDEWFSSLIFLVLFPNAVSIMHSVCLRPHFNCQAKWNILSQNPYLAWGRFHRSSGLNISRFMLKSAAILILDLLLLRFTFQVSTASRVFLALDTAELDSPPWLTVLVKLCSEDASLPGTEKDCLVGTFFFFFCKAMEKR